MTNLKIVIIVSCLLILIYLIIMCVVYLKLRSLKGFPQERLINIFKLVYPIKYFIEENDVINHEIKEIVIDDLVFQLHYYWKGEKKNKDIYLFHSGMNTGYISSFKYFNFLVEDYLCVSFDSRGWGRLQKSSHCTYSWKERDDLYEIIQFIKKDTNFNKLNLHGESMGASVVIEYLAKYDSYLVNKAIIDSGVADYKNTVYKALANIKYIKYFKRLLTITIVMYSYIFDHYNPLKFKPYLKINEIRIPILFFHSKEDKVVNYSDFLKYKVSSDSLSHKFVSFDKGFHTNIILWNYEQYLEQLNIFLNT